MDAMTCTSGCSATTQPQHSCSCSINILLCCCALLCFVVFVIFARMCLYTPVCMPCVSMFVCFLFHLFFFFAALPASGRCIVVVLVCRFNVVAVSFAHTRTHKYKTLFPHFFAHFSGESCSLLTLSLVIFCFCFYVFVFVIVSCLQNFCCESKAACL